MIRPITLLCWCLMLGSGLYLYRAKHGVELLDKRIVQVAKDTEVLRGESRRLLDEWIRLGEPEQLRKYTDQYLGLKTVAPAQFVRIADLATRLPAPRALPVEEIVETQARPAAEAMTAEEAAGEDLPIPPVPPVMTAISMPAASPRDPVETHAPAPKPLPARVAESRTVEEPRVVAPKPAPVRVAEPRMAEEPRAAMPKPAPARNTETRMAEEPRAAQPKPVAAKPIEPRVADTRAREPRRDIQEPRREAQEPRRETRSAPAPNGSMLGMARPGLPPPLPLPVPTPVSATWPGR